MTFTDPDGDPLTYEVVLGHTHNPYNDPNPPAGLYTQGPYVLGTPVEVGGVVVTITATDRHGFTENNQFGILVDPNGAPVIVNPNPDHVIAVGTFIDYDGIRGGSVFSDPEGDPLTYEISLRGQPRGLSVVGTHVSGTIDAVGLIEVTVRAADPFGGKTDDVFLIAAPAPEPGQPNLPETSYAYDDAELELPYLFRISSEDQIPLWDTQPDDNRTSNTGATLGRVLFYDKRLSITNTVSCGSCHQQAHGFASPERFSVGALGEPTRRNVMALANVRYNVQHAWFFDMRALSLQDLVLEPIENPEELGSPLPLLEAKLAATSFYAPLFEAAFGTPRIDRDRIARALAQFLQSLISYRAKYDRAYHPMTNDPPNPELVLTEQELRGAEIFTNGGHNRCNLCHDRNTQASSWPANNGLDAAFTDPGAGGGIFRPASLRNLALTGPYMHDGRFATLREVIDHYDHGVQDSPDLDSLLRVDSYGEPQRLNLSEEDKAALEAFLNTMTDDEFLNDPKFSDPFQ